MQHINSLRTYNSPLRTLRDEANEDTAITVATEGNFEQMPASAINIDTADRESAVNAVQIQMCGGSAANDTFTWKLYGWREGNGMLTLMCAGTAILGAMQVVTYPNNVGAGLPKAKGAVATNKFWADTIVITDNTAVKEFSVVDSGNDRAASLWGDLSGYTNLYLEVTDADGSSPKAGSVSAFYAGW